jgi:hypothetical protein
MRIEYTLPKVPARCLRVEAAAPEPAAIGSRPPRLACLLALAHRFEQLVRTGAVRDYAEIARLGGVSRARAFVGDKVYRQAHSSGETPPSQVPA